MKDTIKNHLPETVKHFIINSGITGLRLIFRPIKFFYNLSYKVLRRAEYHGFNFERELPPIYSKLSELLRNSAVAPFGVKDFLLLSEENQQKSEEIKASIIIPVFNKAEFTFQCLRSLFEKVNLAENEIIVVNNGSSDETAQLLTRLKTKVRAINNADNKGFVEACNQAAAAARGKYLVFLNNDAIVQTGWLESMFETFAADEKIGAVGSMIVYPNGHLQEAGGIVWRDAAAYPYGRNENPRELRFNFAREVDYCSGASLMISKKLFDSLGGFDARFAPAYYEDTDLCMSVRRAGYKVVYQPASQIVHYEGVTSGSDFSSGFRRFQEINRHKFYEKWREVLETDHFPFAKKNIEAASNRKKAKRIVVFFNEVPKPDRDSGSVRMFAILRALNRFARVSLVYIHKREGDEFYENWIGKTGIEIVWIVDFETRFKEEKCDAAILCYPKVADFLFSKVKRKFPEAKVIYDTIDVHFVRLRREYELTGDAKYLGLAESFKRIETRMAQNADQIWCVTENDKNYLHQIVPKAQIEIVPNIHALNERGKSFGERSGLFFIGSFYHRPNIDAVEYFIDEIFPRVLEKIPDLKFYVVGNHPPPELFARNSENVRIEGFVQNVEPFFENCRVFVAPLRYGAGMKGKIGQAFSYGLPTVTTAIGAEGMNLTHEKDILTADDAASFADEIVRVYEDETLWQTLSDNCYRYIENNFTPGIIEQKIAAGFDKIFNERRKLN